MKNLFYTSLFLVSSTLSSAQDVTPSAIQVEFSGGTAGGSYYDVPRGFEGFDKYGKERLSPTGYFMKGILESDQYGKIYFRKIDVVRKEDKTKLGSQQILRFETPLKEIKDGKYLNYFVKGDVINFAQKNHFIYFKADGEHTPDLDQNLSLEDHYRTDQRQTYVMPSIGICNTHQFTKNDFDFESFASLALMPVGYLNYKTTVTVQKMPTTEPVVQNNQGNTFAMGAEAIIEGVVKYKDRYYFKIRFEQNVFGALDQKRNIASNRTTNYELGYDVTKNLNVNVNVENNELLLLNQDRHAIDVFNNVGVGIKYKIPYRKQ